MRRLIGGTTAVLAVAGLLLSAAPAAHSVDAYPSWADVEAARGSASATAAEVARIDGLLEDLAQRAAELGDAAVGAAAGAATAQGALVTVSARHETLSAQLESAAAEADAASAQIGILAAQLYRSGAGELTARILLTDDPSTDLLYQLGMSTRLTATASTLQDLALQRRNQVESLTQQATEATRERDRLATAAAELASSSLAAQVSADAALSGHRERADVLYAQLAVLNNSSAQVEREYRAGVAAEQSYAEQEEQEPGGSSGSSGSGGSGPGGGAVTPAPPAGVVADPASAKAYAATAVAARGWGTAQYDCLVRLWNRESGWRADAYNTSSGAYGIPQSLPGSKMQSAGDDWRTNAVTQITWGLNYIGARYGSPCGAWAHSEDVGWY